MKNITNFIKDIILNESLNLNDYDFSDDFSCDDTDITKRTENVIFKYFPNGTIGWLEGNTPKEIDDLFNNGSLKEIKSIEDQNTDQTFTIYKYKNTFVGVVSSENNESVFVGTDFKL